MNDVTYARKDRRDSLTGEILPGPLHVLDDWQGPHQSLCGRRLKGLGVRTMREPQGEVCPACARHLANGTQDAWRRR